MHRVELADGLVAGYRILAPTEWNFHPAGVVVAGLAGSNLARLPDDAELKRRAALYITAVDPCVAYDLIVEKD
jgi:coenzyme F420-reducing hydrogenase alpha subunit